MKAGVLAACLAAGAAGAEPLYITVPGEGWTLRIEAPPMTLARGTTKDRRFSYMASSLETGITVSLHSETDATGSNEECRETYWSKSRNTPTRKDNVAMATSALAALVTLQAEAVFQGRLIKTANGHAYFVKDGLCMDLHVSHYPYQEGSDRKVEDVLRSISIVP